LTELSRAGRSRVNPVLRTWQPYRPSLRGVNRIQKAVILTAAIATPAVAYSMFAPAEDSLCLGSGAANYRIAHNTATPDFQIKIVGEAAHPDLRMQLVDRAELADFVLVDDLNDHGPAACRSAAPVRTVALHSGAASPDVTVKLSAETTADYKIYVQSARFSQQHAAALLAAMWKANQRGEVTGSIPQIR
jgi:hypothetical protein